MAIINILLLIAESCRLITDKAFKTYPLIPLEEVRVLPKNQRFHEMARMSDAIDEGEIPGDNVFPLWAKLKKLNCKGCEKLSDIALACLAFESEEVNRPDPNPTTWFEQRVTHCVPFRIPSRLRSKNLSWKAASSSPTRVCTI